MFKYRSPELNEVRLQECKNTTPPQYEEVSILAVPYALWQNRGDSRMSVWLRNGRSIG